MNFFERQHAARNASVRLVVLFTLAVILIVAGVDAIAAGVVLSQQGSTSSLIGWVVAATVITLLIIGGGTLSKMLALRAGGVAVAQSVGATAVDPTTTDPQLRRLVNVVEEMSIASGVPMPRLFVLESENAINAFAAGYSPADAAVTVTAGALHRLNRDELQGVIGHEFSHVLNGDMRLNVRLIGLLNGILLLGLVGLRVLAFGPRGGDRRNNNAAMVVVLIGVAMLVLGFVGQFFAGLIQAGVARQREWLADASSVQFTRQTVGLAGALKKIAGLPAGSALHNSHAEKQISHMLFGEGRNRISRLYATHPPLLKRITALDPTFRAAEVEQLAEGWAAEPPDGLAEDARLGLVGGGRAAVQAAPTVQVDPDTIAARVGTFAPADLDRGAALSAQLPPNVRQLANQPSTAVPLVVALLLDADARVRARQVQAVAARLGAGAATAADQLAGRLADLPRLLRLPLVGVAAPTLVARPATQVRAVVDLLDELARTDGVVTVFEYCLTRLVAGYARDALDPGPRSRLGRASTTDLQRAALTLLSVVAVTGNADPGAAERAYAAAVRRLLPGAALPPFVPPQDRLAALDGVWEVLDQLDPRHKQPLIEALVAAVSDDGVLAVAEAELLRTACALLHCPLPPLLA